MVPWLTRLSIPKGISTGSAFLQGSRLWQTPTDRPTDRQTVRPGYMVCNNRLHLWVRSTEMLPIIIKITIYAFLFPHGYHCAILTKYSVSIGNSMLSCFQFRRFLPHDARRYASAVYAVAPCLSLRLSVRPSGTSRSSTKTAKCRIMQTMPHNNPRTL